MFTVKTSESSKRRDEIKEIIAARLKEHTTEHWLEILDAADIGCADVLDWPRLFASEAFREIDMVQTLSDGQGIEVFTTRCPIPLDHAILKSQQLAPGVGHETEAIQKEFGQ
jgi:CoA:oxalate CoA-transferase